MASLSKEDRIEMSKKIIEIPEQNAAIDGVKEQIIAQQQEAIKQDNINAALQDEYDNKIEPYQKELDYLDAISRSVLTEDVINNAAKLVPGNGFFLSEPSTPIPSVPSGVWTSFSPMAYTWAIGKFADETYGVEPLGEDPVLAAIDPILTSIESFVDATRASGLKCEAGGSCSDPAFTTELACTIGGGTWTATEELVPSTEIQEALDNLKAEVQKWIDSLTAQQGVIQVGDTNVPARQAQNQAAFDDVDALLTVLTNWQSIQDFDTTTSLPEDDCTAFNNIVYTGSCSNPIYTDEETCVLNGEIWTTNFEDSKLSKKQINILKDELTQRSSFVSTRKSQLSGYLGSIAQDETGAITASSGWYGQRYAVLETRLNLVSGSAVNKFSAQSGLDVQDQLKASNNNSGAVYGSTMKATKAIAPGIDTKYLNVENASAFSVGDRVYVVADDQEELSGSIEEIQGNRVKLTFNVSKKYTLANKTRLYKLVANIL